MLQTRFIKDITFGGDASDNPPDYDWNTYINYPGLDTSRQYLRQNVIVPVFGPTPLEVTGLIMLGPDMKPLDGPNDLVYLPCPPFC